MNAPTNLLKNIEKLIYKSYVAIFELVIHLKLICILQYIGNLGKSFKKDILYKKKTKLLTYKQYVFIHWTLISSDILQFLHEIRVGLLYF